MGLLLDPRLLITSSTGPRVGSVSPMTNASKKPLMGIGFAVMLNPVASRIGHLCSRRSLRKVMSDSSIICKAGNQSVSEGMRKTRRSESLMDLPVSRASIGLCCLFRQLYSSFAGRNALEQRVSGHVESCLYNLWKARCPIA